MIKFVWTGQNIHTSQNALTIKAVRRGLVRKRLERRVRTQTHTQTHTHPTLPTLFACTGVDKWPSSIHAEEVQTAHHEAALCVCLWHYFPCFTMHKLVTQTQSWASGQPDIITWPRRPHTHTQKWRPYAVNVGNHMYTCWWGTFHFQFACLKCSLGYIIYNSTVVFRTIRHNHMLKQ